MRCMWRRIIDAGGINHNLPQILLGRVFPRTKYSLTVDSALCRSTHPCNKQIVRRPTMQKISPHLWFDREARDAAAFYTSVFSGSSKTKAVTTLQNTPSG